MSSAKLKVHKVSHHQRMSKRWPHAPKNHVALAAYEKFSCCDRTLWLIVWGQLPLSTKAKLNQTVLTWEFPVLNVYLLV